MFLDFRNSGKVHVLQTYEDIPGVGINYIMDIKELVGLIADWEIGNSIGNRWKIEGKPSENPVFEPLFNVHVSFERLK